MTTLTGDDWTVTLPGPGGSSPPVGLKYAVTVTAADRAIAGRTFHLFESNATSRTRICPGASTVALT